MKRKTAKEVIAETFRELAQKKQVDKITVQEIVKGCGYSTATFYRQFKDKYDLIAWDYLRNAKTIMGKIGENGHSWKQILSEGLALYYKDRRYLKNLLRHTSGQDSFFQQMTKANVELLTNEVLKRTHESSLSTKLYLSIKIYCCGTVLLISEWINEDFHILPEELADIFLDALPQALKLFLKNE